MKAPSVARLSNTRDLNCAGQNLDLHRPVVMGVLNVTPDSFSDGGRYIDPEIALSTRPNNGG